MARTYLNGHGVSLRLASGFIVSGSLIALAMGLIHPSRVDPSDHLNVFAEYAASTWWTALHLGQFIGYGLTFCGLALVARAIRKPDGVAEAASWLAIVLAVASIGLYAVVQGIDAVALKFAVDRWAAAATAEEAAILFGVAEALRLSEIGVNSTFRLLQGATYICIGIAIVRLGGPYRLVGMAGVLIGAVVVVRGVAVAFTGFSPANPIYAYTGLFASNVPPILVLWMFGVAWLAWKEGDDRAASEKRSQMA
jgi:hypothetical protein